jgi:4-oxalocrotonate tautomerase family enzyme
MKSRETTKTQARESTAMPIIEVTTLTNTSEEKCKELIEKLTRTTWDVLQCPRNRITVVVTRVPRELFGEGGAAASDPEFLTKRDLTSY